MPPKSSSKKSAAVSWFYCERCNVHLTTTELESHEKVCPIDHLNDSAGFCFDHIWNSVLYTSNINEQTRTIDELADIPSRYVNQLIFMSEGVMRLTQLHIGQAVIVTSENDVVPLVRTVWPIPERFLTTIFVNPEDLKLHWQQFKGFWINIKALPEDNVKIAKRVKIKLLCTPEWKQLNSQQISDLNRSLKQEIKNRVYTNSSTIHFSFFNKMLKFQVVSWSGDEGSSEENTLDAAFKKIQLVEENHCTFFRVVPRTQLGIECPRSNIKAETKLNQVTRADVGGLDEQVEVIEEAMDIALSLREVPQGVKISRAMLIYGSTGCGKTLICEAMCSRLQNSDSPLKPNVIKIKSSELFSKFLGETEKNLAMYFEQAYGEYPTPTLIIIEDIHNLCPKYETNEVVKRVSVALLSILDALSDKKEAQRTFLLATTSNIEALHTGVRRCGRFDREVEITAPSPEARVGILQCILRKVQHNLTSVDIEAIAAVTHGFVGADLSNLVYSASLAALKSPHKIVQASDMHNCLAYIKPSAMREILIENPNVRWSDIGGQQRLKLQLKQSIEWPLLHADKFKRLGIKPPRGMLMFGPPGCSKTMIAKALATESQLNFLSIKGPELFSMWVGESERAVREVFRKARQVAPAIVFFDEIDAIGGERSDGSGTSVKDRVLTQLLTELDGVESLQNVTIVAATNRPDMIDKALLRPGRIDRIVYVGLPDDAARREIFNIKLRAMPLAADVDINRLVAGTKGYSGAELQAVCHEAALRAIEQSFEAVEVKWAQFEYALNVVQPRTSSELLRIYSDYMKNN